MNLTAAAIEKAWFGHMMAQQTVIHLSLFTIALIIVLIGGLSMGICAALNRRWGAVLLQVLNIIEMIPDIALLLLLIPFLGIGAAPTIAAAVLYSLLPLVRNTDTGLRSVRPELIDSGRGLGMTDWQILYKVRVPLALPLIAGGVRTAVVYTMGIVTLGGIIGARGLGAVLQAGITRNNMTVIIVAGVWIGILAVIMDGIAALGEKVLTDRFGDRP